MKAILPFGADGVTPTAQAKQALTTAPQTFTLPGSGVRAGQTVRIMVDGPDPVAWSCGAATSLSMDNGVPMIGNSVEVFSLPTGTTQLTALAKNSGTTTLRVIIGDGA